MTELETIREILNELDPALLDYAEWLKVGSALKHEGGSAFEWDQWSRKDGTRYRAGECDRKWGGLDAGAKAVTVASVCELAKRQGIRVSHSAEPSEYDADDYTPVDYMGVYTLPRIRKEYVMEEELPVVTETGVEQLKHYLKTLFQPDEHVAFTVAAVENGEKFNPAGKGVYTRTCAELIAALDNGGFDFAVGTIENPAAGAWIRFNPFDGNGISDKNVTAFRFGLVECDDVPINEQYAMYKKLKLPIAALVHSGGKSLHAIVRIDADSYEEYVKRMDYIYNACAKNGLNVDTKNRNPSRLSRMPGIMRGDHQQSLLSVNIGLPDFASWKRHISPSVIAGNMLSYAELKSKFKKGSKDEEELIENRFLCRGDAMLFSAETGVGKSSFIAQLCFKFAAGRQCFGLQPAKPLKSLIIQAENNERDLWEEACGIEQGLIQHEQGWTYPEFCRADAGVTYVTYSDTNGMKFVEYLDELLVSVDVKPDLLVIDPLFAFAGCDVSAEQGKLSAFLRNGLQPLIRKHKVGCIIVHHTAKPSKEITVRNVNFNEAYNYAGSAELANWVRGILSLESVYTSDDTTDKKQRIFCLKSGKRGSRIRHDFHMWLKWAEDCIFWLPAEPPQQNVNNSAQNRARTEDAKAQRHQISSEVLAYLLNAGRASKKQIVATLSHEAGYSRQGITDAVVFLCSCGAVAFEKDEHRNTVYFINPAKETEIEKATNT